MSDDERVKQYAMAVKYGEKAPLDWRERLAQIPGVTIMGATSTRAHFTATSEAGARVQKEFPQFRVEEAAERRPAD
jgi:hypothetical protein